jgi:hypothetical protein
MTTLSPIEHIAAQSWAPSKHVMGIAWDLYEAGRVHLLQRVHGLPVERRFDYLAVGKSPPYRPVLSKEEREEQGKMPAISMTMIKARRNPIAPADLLEHACVGTVTLERDIQDEWHFVIYMVFFDYAYA